MFFLAIPVRGASATVGCQVGDAPGPPNCEGFRNVGDLAGSPDCVPTATQTAMVPGGRILITHRVHAAVGDRVTASSLGGHDFKGFSSPVSLCQSDGVR